MLVLNFFKYFNVLIFSLEYILPSLFILLVLTHFSPCAGRNISKRPIADRRSLPVLVSRRRVSPKEDPCDGAYMRSSTCLPDGYRTFPVWIYCDYCGLKLINLELPQCCSCKRYNKCYDVKTVNNA